MTDELFLRRFAGTMGESLKANGLWEDPPASVMDFQPAPERAGSADEVSFNEVRRQLGAILAAEEEGDLKPLTDLIRSDFAIHPLVRACLADLLDPDRPVERKRY